MLGYSTVLCDTGWIPLLWDSIVSAQVGGLGEIKIHYWYYIIRDNVKVVVRVWPSM